MRAIAFVPLLALVACVSASANLARLQQECALAPLAEIGSSFIPVPGAGGIINMAIGEVCSHTEMIANDEAAIAAAVEGIIQRRAGRQSTPR